MNNVRAKNGISKGEEVKLEGETVWLAQADISILFRTERSVITKHLRNIFNSKELDEKSNVQKMHIPFSDKPVKFYNLDAVISVGYRINSARATQFRIWATNVLRGHLINGYTGNKRIAAVMFLWFLEGNGLLYKEDGTKRIADNALVALTLMIAESDPAERDIIVSLVVNLINKHN